MNGFKYTILLMKSDALFIELLSLFASMSALIMSMLAALLYRGCNEN
ncbi:Uncharacterised protein [Budvicia aquatica]|uniref:Uncharacterized protein n=1 Tax=Budvicia aquatica TaxID=82979 RepID=A0A484Z9W7_9GAMM|nr:Uncharacterised protein [Budvicia aquatica]